MIRAQRSARAAQRLRRSLRRRAPFTGACFLLFLGLSNVIKDRYPIQCTVDVFTAFDFILPAVLTHGAPFTSLDRISDHHERDR